jgi:hypothetical protein
MAGGNYGGNSIPTTPLNVAQVLTLGSTTYKNYNCTSVIASAASATFTYEGQAIAVANGTTMDLLISPAGVTAAANVIFLCYDCSCSSPMTGVTYPSANYDITRDFFRPTIIGGGGLNS